MKNRNNGIMECWNGGENKEYKKQVAEQTILHLFHYSILPIFHYSSELGVLRSGCRGKNPQTRN
jgi:hypothetical protein